MPETKTFKNFYHINHGSDWVEVYPYENNELASVRFNEDDWDMEITFTKKVPKPEVGGTCKLTGYSSQLNKVYTIIAVSDDLVWVRDQNDDYEENTGWIEPVSRLVDIKPWNPA